MPYPPKLRSQHHRNLKLGRALALNLRHSKLSSLLVILITFPFITTIILSNVYSNAPKPPSTPSSHPRKTSTDPFSIPHTNRDRPSITIPEYLRHQSIRNHITHSNNTISLLAACMNRRETLQYSLPSWLSIPQITQIIIVDWSSTPPIPPIHHRQISFIRVENAETWVLSRAYNLASKFAIGQYILKVDCDTHLEPTFLNNHPLPPLAKYYTAYTPDTTLSHPLRGVWFAHTRDFHRIGGYDERIVDYGYEDTDLYRRFDQFLQPIPLDLESVRHHTTHTTHSYHLPSSHKISTLLNAAFLRNTTSWGPSTNSSSYTFSYAESDNVLYASITHNPPAVHESTSVETRNSVKAHVLQETLHEHGLPRALVRGLDLADQEFLAAYFEADRNNRVIVALLISDTLGNVFNLVSALQAGITSGRPVITVWQNLDATTLNSLIDVPATNRRLREVVQTVSARRHGFSQSSRFIPAREWGCVDTSCTNDLAYGAFVKVGEKQIYDERNPLPISVKHHAFVSLNGTKIGGNETRRLAYGCITWSYAVTKIFEKFREDVAITAEREFPKVDVKLRTKGIIGVVGRHAKAVRRLLGLEICDGCEKSSLVIQVANVLAVVAARRVVPGVGEVGEWTPNTNAFVADLRSLHRAVSADKAR